VQTFLCDAMLGSLARWLRFFGYDAEFGDPSLADHVLVDRARTEGRWLLTRDRGLASFGPRTVLIRSDELDGQLVEVCQRLGLRPEPGLERARCGECNGELKPVDADQIAELVPPYVFRTAERFKRCDGCGRVYWPGSHGERIVEKMQGVIDALGGEAESETSERAQGPPDRPE
jgi:uncharacterized protein with PIN domain